MGAGKPIRSPGGITISFDAIFFEASAKQSVDGSFLRQHSTAKKCRDPHRKSRRTSKKNKNI